MEKTRTPKFKNNGTNNTGRIRKVKRTSSHVTPALKEESENEDLVIFYLFFCQFTLGQKHQKVYRKINHS